MLGLDRKGDRFALKGNRFALRALLAAATMCVAVTSASAQQTTDSQPGKEGNSKDSQVAQPSPVPALPEERVGNRLSFAGGVDAASHFVSFGGDVWGGGYEISPFSSRSTAFAHGTVTSKFTDEFSGFVNLWSDLNDNVDSNIGGPIQEIDLNVGVNYTLDKFTFGLTYAYWMFGGGAEKAVEASVAFNDKDLIFKGFAFNPSFLAHYRFDSTGDLTGENACVFQVGINPGVTFMEETEYPITVSVPMNVAYFTDPYQGGNGAGFGYFNAGLSASVPLSFIPKGYGNWTASVSEIYFHTPSDDIPNNDAENFFVTTLSLGVTF